MSDVVHITSAVSRYIQAGTKRFHTDADCPRLGVSESVQHTSPDQLGDEWSECQWCAGEVTQRGRHDDVQCPKCGEPTGSLGNHLQGCDA